MQRIDSCERRCTLPALAAGNGRLSNTNLSHVVKFWARATAGSKEFSFLQDASRTSWYIKVHETWHFSRYLDGYVSFGTLLSFPRNAILTTPNLSLWIVSIPWIWICGLDNDVIWANSDTGSYKYVLAPIHLWETIDDHCNVVLPSISSEFQKSHQASWLGTAYALNHLVLNSDVKPTSSVTCSRQLHLHPYTDA